MSKSNNENLIVLKSKYGTEKIDTSEFRNIAKYTIHDLSESKNLIMLVPMYKNSKSGTSRNCILIKKDSYLKKNEIRPVAFWLNEEYDFDDDCEDNEFHEAYLLTFYNEPQCICDWFYDFHESYGIFEDCELNFQDLKKIHNLISIL